MIRKFWKISMLDVDACFSLKTHPWGAITPDLSAFNLHHQLLCGWIVQLLIFRTSSDLFFVVSIYRNYNYNLQLRCGFWGGYRLIIFCVRMRCTQFFAIREKYILQFEKIYFVNWDKYGSGLIIFYVRMRCTQSFAIWEKYILQFENNSFLKLRQICPQSHYIFRQKEVHPPTQFHHFGRSRVLSLLMVMVMVFNQGGGAIIQPGG